MADLEHNPDNIVDAEKVAFPIMRGNAAMAVGAGFFEVPLFSQVIDGLWHGCSPAEFPDELEEWEYDFQRIPYHKLVEIERAMRNGMIVDCHWLWETQVDSHPVVGGRPLETEIRVPRFNAILNLYPWGKYRVPDGVTYQEVEMYDGHGEPDKDQIDGLALSVAMAVKVGQRVLVHCQAGLNRSSLVIVRALMLGWDMTADQAIDLVRGSRSPMCLCNDNFEQFLRSLDG